MAPALTASVVLIVVGCEALSKGKLCHPTGRYSSLMMKPIAVFGAVLSAEATLQIRAATKIGMILFIGNEVGLVYSYPQI